MRLLLKIFFFKNFNFFPKKVFYAFWALDMAPTWDVPVLFFFQLTISLWVVHFSYNFCSSFIFVHLSSSTQPESVGSNPALNHKFFNEFFGIVRPKKSFFSKKKSKFFWKKNFFPNFSNSCSLNIFEPKIWRRLGTFPSCLIQHIISQLNSTSVNHIETRKSSELGVTNFFDG